MTSHITDTSLLLQTEDGRKDPRVVVESEDQPERLLLETKIQKEDGFQKQQGMPSIYPSFTIPDV